MGIKIGLAGMTIMLLASGCIESTGYPATSYAGGYSGYDSGYYGQQTYYPAYPAYRVYTPPPTVVTQTRYVPVPTPPQHEVRRAEDRNRDARKDDRHADRRDHHDHDNNNNDTDRSRH